MADEKVMNVTIEQAVEVLAIFGSDDDPLTCKEFPDCTSPHDLAMTVPQPNRLAKTLRVSYWVDGGMRVHGTLSGMMKERMR